CRARISTATGSAEATVEITETMLPGHAALPNGFGLDYIGDDGRTVTAGVAPNALLAYQLSLNGQPAPVIDGLTGVQRVFYGWAQVWRTKSREAEAIRRLAVDPHSPPEFRCNGVLRNMDAFYDAFDGADVGALFLEPDKRVKIWN
ncbi:M13-type metalloendopeptidase, partial [Mycobacterium sp. 1482292.6]|uniref:M13-type metalloendopeptidase n=1 Tax=Mycobacterium sp. 1482292.6 TaxID=1834081 RepID=UPI000A4217D5